MVEKISLSLREMGYTDDDFADEILPGYLVLDLKSENPNPYNGLIDFDKVEAAFTIRSGWDTNADRITVFKLTDLNYLSVIKNVLEEEKAGQYEIWEQYIQEEFHKVKNTLIEIEGNLVYYITYSDAEEIEQIILNSFK